MDDNDLVLAMLGLACAGLPLVFGLFLITGDNRTPADIVKPAPTATAALGAKH
jgi:hypothetical protein